MGSSTVHTIFMARPSEEEMELFWKLYNAAQRVEDRWHRNTVGPIADELSHCPNLTRQEKMLLLRAWQVLVDGIGGFGRFMGAFDTYAHNMQDPSVGHVAYKPSLIEMFGNAELLPVVIEAYQDALTALEEKDKTLALVREQRDNELRTNTELERANSAQDDHINQQQDRIDTLERKNDELGKYAGKLEQPIKLPNTTTNRHEWTTWQWIEHVGGRYQHGCPMDYIEFGSVMAVGAMLKQFQRTVIAVALVEIKNSLRLQGFKVEEE
ncbi:hypothetical protein [Serratia fonticola]|uniref:hypothetical protein n=1 Tax=Serratia fonticola TaxID=47917 RepID=UPI003AAC9F7F|nr:hypothetical protein [Serratia fonticola]HBE9089365.1 hypothetical protein [Serratia fonticola]